MLFPQVSKLLRNIFESAPPTLLRMLSHPTLSFSLVSLSLSCLFWPRRQSISLQQKEVRPRSASSAVFCLSGRPRSAFAASDVPWESAQLLISIRAVVVRQPLSRGQPRGKRATTSSSLSSPSSFVRSNSLRAHRAFLGKGARAFFGLSDLASGMLSATKTRP